MLGRMLLRGLFGFGLFFCLPFLLLWFLFPLFGWRRWGWARQREHWGKGAPPMFEEWHKRAHGQSPSQAETPSAAESQ